MQTSKHRAKTKPRLVSKILIKRGKIKNLSSQIKAEKESKARSNKSTTSTLNQMQRT